MTMTDKEMLEILTGNKCHCGRSKGLMKSHCKGCYYALPPEMRKALYRGFFDGYQEAFLASLEYLAEVAK